MKKRTALITGSTSGIGLGIAKTIAEMTLLVAQRANTITGASLSIDGGWSAK